MVSIYRGVISYNLGKNVLFDKIGYGENFLILYSYTNAHKHIFHNFMKSYVKLGGDNKNSLLLYVSHKTNPLDFPFEVRNYFFNILSDNIVQDLKKQLDKYFTEMEKYNSNMLLIADWSNANLSKCETFIPFLDSLIKKSQGLTPPGWKRRYGDIKHKTPFTLINAFDVANLDDNFVQKIILMHQRVYVLQENVNTFLLPTVSPSNETIFPKIHVLSNDALEKLVKDNLVLVILILLKFGGKSGYQILKDIASHFHCILSQGTLYPLLYQLEKENKIVKRDGKGREIVYSLTEETRSDLRERIEIYLKGYQHLASFFEA